MGIPWFALVGSIGALRVHSKLVHAATKVSFERGSFLKEYSSFLK
jgi:hypothetical protein